MYVYTHIHTFIYRCLMSRSLIMTLGLRHLTRYPNRFLSPPTPPNLYHHLLSCSNPKPGNQLLFHSHIQSTYIQFILPPTLISCNPDHSNSLGLTASILALANPFSTQQPAMLKQNRSCCCLTQNPSIPSDYIYSKILH